MGGDCAAHAGGEAFELRRAIYHLGERHANELDNHRARSGNAEQWNRSGWAWPEMASEPHRLMSDSGKCARDVAESCAYFGPEIRDGHHADYGDQAHKHSVFDQGRALVIGAEPID
jgi:hypothetical protein